MTVASQYFKSQGLQSVTGQNGGGFIKSFVAGGFASSKVIVIHRWKIIMHQGVRVDQLYSAGSRVCLSLLAAQGFRGGINQDRSNTFAAVKNGVGHSLNQSFADLTDSGKMILSCSSTRL